MGLVTPRLSRGKVGPQEQIPAWVTVDTPTAGTMNCLRNGALHAMTALVQGQIMFLTDRKDLPYSCMTQRGHILDVSLGHVLGKAGWVETVEAEDGAPGAHQLWVSPPFLPLRHCPS